MAGHTKRTDFGKKQARTHTLMGGKVSPPNMSSTAASSSTQLDEINALKRALLEAKSEIEELKRDRDRLRQLVGDSQEHSDASDTKQQQAKREHPPTSTGTTSSTCKRHRASAGDATGAEAQARAAM